MVVEGSEYRRNSTAHLLEYFSCPPPPQRCSLCLVLIWEVVRRNATSVPERQGINTEKSYAPDLPSRCGWDLQRHLFFRKSDPEQALLLARSLHLCALCGQGRLGRAASTYSVRMYVRTTWLLGKANRTQSNRIPSSVCFPPCYVCSLLYAGVREARIVMGLTTQNMISPYRVSTRGYLSP